MKFASFASLFLKHHVAKLAHQTSQQYTFAMNNHLIPAFRHLVITKITRQHVVDLHEALRGTPYIANRCVSIVSSMYNWASEAGHIEHGVNPAARIRKYHEHGKERFLSPDEYERLGKALASHPDTHFVGAILLILHTGCRKNEILQLRWDQIDFHHRCIMRMKRKRGTVSVAINDAAMVVFEHLYKHRISKWVIAGREDDTPRATIEKQWQRVRAQCDLTDVRIHDLRHSFAALAASSGQSLLIIGKLLGHSDVRSTKRYAHLADKATNAAGNLVGREVGSLIRWNPQPSIE